MHGVVGMADGVADRNVLDAGYNTDVSAGDLSCFYPLQALVAETLVDLVASALALVVDDDNGLCGVDGAPVDAADPQASYVIVVG